MDLPKIVSKLPSKVNVKNDTRYAWCSCGLSIKDPYCDGSHKGTGFKPVIIKENEEEIVRAVHVLGLNHQGVDLVVDQTNNKVCFLEVQPTYASGYPQEGYCGYVKPFYNPSDSYLVKFLVDNKDSLIKEIPMYYNNWLDKNNHFDLVYKELKEYVRS